MTVEELEAAYLQLRADFDAFRRHIGKPIAIVADMSERLPAVEYELCRILNGARHLQKDPDARPEMPPTASLRAVFRHKPYPRVEFVDTAETEPSPPPDWEAERMRTEPAPPPEGEKP